MNVKFDLFDNVVVRNPLFCPDEITFEDFKKNTIAKMSVYLASKILYYESIKNSSETLNKSLYKYYLRSKYRPTPFGIFGSISVGKFNTSTNVLFDDKKSFCHIKFDSGFLSEIAKNSNSKTSSFYFLNPTVYLFHGVYRYINDFQNSSICEFNANTLIRKFLNLSKKGISFDSAINYFLSNGINKELAINFLNDLIDRNILLSTKSKFIGHDSVDFYKKGIAISIKKIIPSKLYLDELNKLIEYEDLISNLKDFKTSNYSIFHVDFYRDAVSNNIGSKIKKRILNVIPFFLNSNLFEIENSRLNSFIDEFKNKYDKQEVPLLQALDPIVGIGYPIKSFKTSTNFLVNDVDLETKITDDKLILSNFEKHLLKKIINFQNVDSNEISIDENEFVNEKLDTNAIPSTFSVICELLKDERILIKSIGGSTANNLLSRFSMFPTMNELSRQIATYEKEQQSESRILVDICFLPPRKESNVVSRDLFYDHFIYFYPWEGMDLKKAISLDEISIRIQQGKIILFCKKLNKEIVPILPSAHNYFKDNTFFIYEFFCDVQGSKFSSSFSSCIENLLSIVNHIPRIIYKQCVLSKEKWVVDINDFECLLITKEQFMTKGYPDKFFIVEGDNELLIDLNEKIEIDIFNITINKKKRIIIEEFIEHFDGIKLKNSPIRNELIISIKKI